MELPELRALVKVVQSGSFTRAAELLGTQKSQVSRVITGLEQRLGVRLLERSTRSLRLTEIGREVFERAVSILASVEDTERLTQQQAAEPLGTLKLTCGVEFGMLAVGAWIDSYLVRYPEVNVEADYTGRVIDLVHEGYDLAIRVGELPDSRLVARRLGNLDYGLFASQRYLRQRGTPRLPDDLADHAHLVFSGGVSTNRWTLQRETQSIDIHLNARLRVNNSFIIRDAAINAMGIARLPLLIAQDAVASGALKPVLPDWTTTPMPVHAIYPSSRFLTPKVRRFVDVATDWFGDTVA